MENIKNSSRTADFLTPRNLAHTLFRDAVLDLVEEHAFARPLVNSGRLSLPCTYDASKLNSEDALTNGPAGSRPGSACPDAPLANGHLLDQLGDRFVILAIDAGVPSQLTIRNAEIDVVIVSATDDPTRAVAERYLGRNTSAIYLIRPDQHVAARWAEFDNDAVRNAVQRALGGIKG